MTALFFLTIHMISIEDMAKRIQQAVNLDSFLIIEEMENIHHRICRLDDDGLVLFSSSDGVIEYFDINTRMLSTLSVKGQGPNEMNGGFLHGSHLGDQIVFSEINTNKTKAFSTQTGKHKTVWQETTFSTRQHIPLSDTFIMALVDRPGWTIKGFAEYANPKHTLALFEINEKGEWDLHGTFYEAEIMDEQEADWYYSQWTELFKTSNPEQFLRLPKWASPVMYVMNLQGLVEMEVPIPHPHARHLSKMPTIKLLKHQQRKIQLTVANATQDNDFNLHMLMDYLKVEGEDWSKRLIVTITEKGNILQVKRLANKVRHLTVTGDGKAYYAVDENNNLVFLSQ